MTRQSAAIKAEIDTLVGAFKSGFAKLASMG